MKIYTKTGDTGDTAIWGGKRLPKDHVQVEAYGTVDELTTVIGLVMTHSEIEKEDRALLTDIQRDLYIIMSRLCDANVDFTEVDKRLADIEKFIDGVEKSKPTPPKFILIQGSKTSISCHMARVVCRRAERRVITYIKSVDSVDSEDSEAKSSMVQYLNRLSDMLFAMGRKYNNEEEVFA